ncbi:hypothetical protein [Pedobacter sp.]|jgi:hypothetical protein|uniref:hypothetical protein n=1 Tax=Pedobacter sp. TaxID=1411316 RepID=UPI002CAD75A8|nr:hypothetical protein [Pedobacter sp.]HWW38107.1 hypothetical protein [Pedobacter sp.]
MIRRIKALQIALKLIERELQTRAKTVALTEEGKESIKKAVIVVEKFDSDFFSLLRIKAKKLNNNLLTLLKNKLK